MSPRINIEIDMLKGNINRMAVTNDIKELESMRDWAKRRIDTIFDCRQEDLANINKGRNER